MNALPPLSASGPGPSLRDSRNARVIAVSEDADLADALSRLLDSDGIATAEILPAGIDPIALASEKADLFVIDLGEETDPAAKVSEYASVTDKPVAVIGTVNDINYYHQVIDAGAVDYLVPPFTESKLMELIGRVIARPPQAADPETCRFNLMIGTRGGVGTTALAVSTAWLSAEAWNTPTALLDLDLRFGSCALSLDLLPGPGLRDALEHPERIDSLFVGSSMINATDRLFVLGSEDALESSIRIADDAIETLVEAVKPTVDVIVVDLPRAAVGAHQSMLQDAHTVTLVSNLTVAGLRDTVRLQTFLTDRLGLSTVQIAAIEAPDRTAHISKKEFQQGIGRDVTFWLPYDPKMMAAAASQGKAPPDLAGTRHAYTKACSLIARDFAGAEEAKERRRFWRW